MAERIWRAAGFFCGVEHGYDGRMDILDLNTKKVLNNGVEMPVFGLGVYKSAGDTKQAVLNALEAGYRHIDTAALYKNEQMVGEAIKESGIPREEIFVTTKLWNDDMRNGSQMEAFEKSLSLLDMDYVDLYLIHWPVSSALEESWKVLEQIYKEGRARAIGVSNCHMQHLMRVMAVANVVPAVNQLECHPYLSQKPLRTFCNNLSIEVTAWSPLGRGRVLEDETITALADKYNKTPAQIVLRWELQENIIVIPKSVHKERIIENAGIFDFNLDAKDMKLMNGLNKDMHFGTSPDDFESKQW